MSQKPEHASDVCYTIYVLFMQKRWSGDTMPTITVDLTSLPELTNEAFYPLFEDRSRYLVLKGGGGSGKSVFAAQKVVVRTLAEKRHRILVVRKVGKTIRESVFAEIRKVISDWGLTHLFKVNMSDLRIQCLNGNEILFAGLDDVEKLKSIHGVTSIWIEEASELEVTDFRQLDIRLRGKTPNYKQMILSFNPVSITHWLKTEFFDAKKPDCTISETTYRDNRFLDEEAKKVLEGFRDTDPYYYMVYCLGEWGTFGQTVFNAQVVTERISQLRGRSPLKRGYFVYRYENEKIVDDTIQWVDDENGYIAIYEDVKPGYPYVIGGDTAGDGSDYFTGQVLNNVTGVQAAVLRHRFDEDLYTRQMYCLGKYYNTALEGIETNYSTFPVKELARLGYTRQYVREKIDTYTGKTQETYGFRTDKLSRPLIIANLVQIVREHPELFNDISTLEEMLTFVRNEKGRAEAQEGKHDDLIMALAIAFYIRSQQRFSAQMEQTLDLSKLPEDIVDDYWSAPESERPRLLKKWGIVG